MARDVFLTIKYLQWINRDVCRWVFNSRCFIIFISANMVFRRYISVFVILNQHSVYNKRTHEMWVLGFSSVCIAELQVIIRRSNNVLWTNGHTYDLVADWVNRINGSEAVACQYIGVHVINHDIYSNHLEVYFLEFLQYVSSNFGSNRHIIKLRWGNILVVANKGSLCSFFVEII